VTSEKQANSVHPDICTATLETHAASQLAWIPISPICLQVLSRLKSVELPLGEAFVPDLSPVTRARKNDLDQPMLYSLSFIRNPNGRIVLDRRFNTAAMLSTYYGGLDSILQSVAWDIQDPNELTLQLPSGGSVQTRVTRRLQETPGTQRLDTSEFLRQTFSAERGMESRVKASQCFTKYKWRDAEEAAGGGGVQIVATQVVSEFLTSFDDNALFMRSMGKPVVVYTYKMSFVRDTAVA
jgi:hypothetical protein